MSIYQEIILDHYHNPRNFGNLEHPTSTIDVSNPLCGDKIKMSVLERDGIVQDIKFIGEGCAISLASASMLTEQAKGKTVEELRKWQPEVIIKMLEIQLSPNRLKCALLPLEALQKVISRR